MELDGNTTRCFETESRRQTLVIKTIIQIMIMTITNLNVNKKAKLNLNEEKAKLLNKLWYPSNNFLQ